MGYLLGFGSPWTMDPSRILCSAPSRPYKQDSFGRFGAPFTTVDSWIQSFLLFQMIFSLVKLIQFTRAHRCWGFTTMLVVKLPMPCQLSNHSDRSPQPGHRVPWREKNPESGGLRLAAGGQAFSPPKQMFRPYFNIHRIHIVTPQKYIYKTIVHQTSKLVQQNLYFFSVILLGVHKWMPHQKHSRKPQNQMSLLSHGVGKTFFSASKLFLETQCGTIGTYHAISLGTIFGGSPQ